MNVLQTHRILAVFYGFVLENHRLEVKIGTVVKNQLSGKFCFTILKHALFSQTMVLTTQMLRTQSLT